MADADETDEEAVEEVDVEGWEDRAADLVDSTVLSPRQAEVFALKERGLIHKQIASVTGMRKQTVDTHSERINHKFDEASVLVEAVEALVADDEEDDDEEGEDAADAEDVEVEEVSA